MKKIFVLSLILGLALTACNSTGSKKLSTDKDTLAYAYGAVQFGPNIAYLDSVQNLNVGIILAAIQDVVAGKPKMTPEEANAWAQEYYTVRVPAQNLSTSVAFLAETEKKSGVMKTESGLLYEIIAEGGEKATNDADTLVVVYTGTLPNGKEFDSTKAHGTENDQFALNNVIPAWTEGMKLVGKGGKIKLYAHPDLAYGPMGQGSIEPNQALIFDVEIIDIKPAAVAAE